MGFLWLHGRTVKETGEQVESEGGERGWRAGEPVLRQRRRKAAQADIYAQHHPAPRAQADIYAQTPPCSPSTGTTSTPITTRLPEHRHDIYAQHHPAPRAQARHLRPTPPGSASPSPSPEPPCVDNNNNRNYDGRVLRSA
ncbi:unnamed protein product [Boreogadus saida]